MYDTLSHIADGTTVEVVNVSSSDLRVKLLEMGILEGQSLRVLYRAPFGDPIAVDVNGYVLSLRLDEAALVNVELKPQSAAQLHLAPKTVRA